MKKRHPRALTTGLLVAAAALLVATGCSATYLLDAVDLASYIAQSLAGTTSAVQSLASTTTDSNSP